MSKSKHTPGPWTIEPHGKHYALYSGRDNMRHGLNLVYLNEPDHNWESNARLIAAAPELLEACEAALHEVCSTELYLLLEAAIDKATGADDANS